MTFKYVKNNKYKNNTSGVGKKWTCEHINHIPIPDILASQTGLNPNLQAAD